MCFGYTPTGNHTGPPLANPRRAPSGGRCVRLATLASLRGPRRGRANRDKQALLQNKLYTPDFVAGVCLYERAMTQHGFPKFSFMSANFLGREKNYQNVIGFGEGDTSVAEVFAPAATYVERIDELFSEVAAMGYRGIDLWTAHCNPEWAKSQHVDGLLKASAKHGVEIVSLAGGLGDGLEQIEETCRMAQDIRCPLLGLGCRALPQRGAEVEALLAKYGVKLAFENHPNEPTPEAVLEKIGYGRFPHIGSTFDTGWWGTHGYPVLEALDALREHLLLVHLKNVREPVTHIAARWDEGCLDLASIVRRLKHIGYSGWISLEYEPEDHDPTEDCHEFLKVATAWWKN